MGGSQMRHHAHQVLPLVVAQTNEFAIGLAAPREIKGEHGHAQGQQAGELGQHLHPCRGIAVHINDDRDPIRRALHGLPVRALQAHPPHGPQRKVGAGEASAQEGECRGAEVLFAVVGARRADDGLQLGYSFLIA